MTDQKTFPADKISGADGCNMAISAVLGVFRYYQKDALFKYPFYGLRVDVERGRMTEFVRREGYARESERIIAHAREHGLGYLSDTKTRISALSDPFRIYAADVETKLPALSDDELIAAYTEATDRYMADYAAGLITFLCEETISEKLHASIAARRDDAAEVIAAALASEYTSFILEGERALLAIKDAGEAEREYLMQAYLKDFYYMGSTYLARPILTHQAIGDMAAHAERHPQRAQRIEEIPLTDEERLLAATLREMEVIRDQRKKIATIGSYLMHAFADEAAHRTGLSGNLVRRMFWNEYERLLREPHSFKPILEQRKITSSVLDGDTRYYLDYDAFIDRTVESEGKTECKGTPASVGKAMGCVRIVLGTSDFGKMERGDILVSEMTRPEFVPVMRLASAIVTDEGGLTCHAAVVAREMRKPCVVGTRNATSVFADGDLVEVDAERGVVRLLG